MVLISMHNDIAIVTGGAKGLGLSIAKLLLENGAKVIIFDKDEINLKNLPNIFEKYIVDVTNKKEVEQAINNIVERYGKINILVNNAGTIYSQPLINITSKTECVHDYDKYKKIIEVNMHSVFLMSSLVAEKMILKRTKGVIINISSICAEGNAGQSAYSAAKAGVNAFAKVWAKELGAFGIRVVAIAPGFMDTDSTKKALNSSMIENIKIRTPLRCLGDPSCIAKMVISVISNPFVNGEVINVSGGLVL